MPKRPQKKSNQPEPPVPPEHPDAKPEPGDIGLQAIATLDKHKKTVIVATLAGAFAICAGLVIQQIREQKRLAAAAAYSDAASERSIEKLDAVVADHSGSTAAGNALLTKSEIQLSMDKPEDAKIALLSFAENFKKHPRYVQGLFALGSLHQNSGDSVQAGDYYKQALAAGPDSDIAPLIVIRQGDLALEEADRLLKDGKSEEAEKKKNEARASYEESVRRINFRANSFIPLAEEKIELLSIRDVPVVPPPPPPPESEKPEPPKPAPGAGTVLKPPGGLKPAPTQKIPGAPKSDSPKPGEPKPDAPKSDAPKSDAPKSDAPKSDAPKSDAPKSDAPKSDAPKSDAPKSDAPKSDAPKPDAPKPDAPKPDAPKPDAPKPDAPKPDAPKPDAPKPDAPKPDAPKPDAPKPDAPKPDAPKSDAPKPVEPKPEGGEKANADSPAAPDPATPAPKPE